MAGGDTIRGIVVDGNDGTPVPATEVAFFTSVGGQVNEVVRKNADDEGRFVFSGPFLTPDLTFVLVALHQGIPYPSSELRADGQTEVILEVFEPSPEEGALRISSHSILISLGASALDIAHFVQVENSGERTFVGSGSGAERRVMEFALPPALFNMAGTLVPAGGERFFDNRPLPPGHTEVSFNFQLDPAQIENGYPHLALYPTDVLDLYLQPASSEPGDPFEDLGLADLHGSRYRHLRATNLRAGQTLSVPLDLPREVRWLFKWMALAAAGVASVLTFAVRPSSASPGVSTDRQGAEQRQRRLLQQIADLDDTHAGNAQEAGYLQRRQALLTEAIALRRGLMEGDGNRRV